MGGGRASMDSRHSAHLALERLDAILASGGDVNAPGFGGETALHIVAQKLKMASTFDPETAHLAQVAWHHLVARGAESSAVDADGRTPLERLSRQQCRDLLSAKRKSYSSKRYDKLRV